MEEAHGEAGAVELAPHGEPGEPGVLRRVQLLAGEPV